jgi:hypothetical protein
MEKMTSMFCRFVALAVAALASGCANQSGSPSAQAVIQGAVNAFGAGLGGKPVGGATPSEVASTTGGGKVVVINGVLIAVDGEHPSDPRWVGKLIKDTPLLRFFEQHPTRRPGDYFPRIAIRIDDYSPSLVANSGITKHLNMSPAQRRDRLNA